MTDAQGIGTELSGGAKMRALLKDESSVTPTVSSTPAETASPLPTELENVAPTDDGAEKKMGYFENMAARHVPKEDGELATGDWKLFPDELTKYFSDAGIRNQIRQLMIVAENGKGEKMAQARVELAKLKQEAMTKTQPVEPASQGKLPIEDPNERVNSKYRRGDI